MNRGHDVWVRPGGERGWWATVLASLDERATRGPAATELLSAERVCIGRSLGADVARALIERLDAPAGATVELVEAEGLRASAPGLMFPPGRFSLAEGADVTINALCSRALSLVAERRVFGVAGPGELTLRMGLFHTAQLRVLLRVDVKAEAVHARLLDVKQRADFAGAAGAAAVAPVRSAIEAYCARNRVLEPVLPIEGGDAAGGRHVLCEVDRDGAYAAVWGWGNVPEPDVLRDLVTSIEPRARSLELHW